jgi:hypothetical protein
MYEGKNATSLQEYFFSFLTSRMSRRFHKLETSFDLDSFYLSNQVSAEIRFFPAAV